MKAVRVRVRNFRNVDDSGWIALERVTAFVGRNEAGKTSLLKALHKFNPVAPELYDAQREFPRDRYTRDYVARGSNGANWPVCLIEFELTPELRSGIGQLLSDGSEPPDNVTLTRRYDGSQEFEYAPALVEMTSNGWTGRLGQTATGMLSHAIAGTSPPSGLSCAPATHSLAGAIDVRFRDSCTHWVRHSSVAETTATDTAAPPATPARTVGFITDPDRANWRITERRRRRFGRRGHEVGYCHDAQSQLVPPLLALQFARSR